MKRRTADGTTRTRSGWEGYAGCSVDSAEVPMREVEASLQQFGEFILRGRLVKEKAAPYCVGWVRRFLARSASDESPADQVRVVLGVSQSDVVNRSTRRCRPAPSRQ